jgi:late competence protein required for DNA uptake (superfamily II DNA/RNA helicase)
MNAGSTSNCPKKTTGSTVSEQDDQVERVIALTGSGKGEVVYDVEFDEQ